MFNTKFKFYIICLLIGIFSNSAVLAEDGEKIPEENVVAANAYGTGTREKLPPNLVGLANMGITFLPSDLKFVNVIEATRQVENGVRYDLLINTKDSNDTDIVCNIIVYEKPWVWLEWGDKLRTLEYSNCSSVEDNETVKDTNVYHENTIFNRENTVLTSGDIENLEMQIIQPKPNKLKPSNKDEGQNLIDTNREHVPITTTVKTTDELNDNSKTILDDIFHVNIQTGSMSQREHASPPPTYNVEPNVLFENTETGHAESSTNYEQRGTVTGTEERKELSNELKSFLDGLFIFNYPAANETSVSDDDDDGRIEVTEEIIVPQRIDRNRPVSNSFDSPCSAGHRYGDNLREPTYLRDFPNMHRETYNGGVYEISSQSDNTEDTPRNFEHNEHQRNRDRLVGAPIEADNEEIEELTKYVQDSLATWTARGEEPGYSLNRVFSVTKQVVSGVSYDLNAELATSSSSAENCTVNIWRRPWLKEDNSEITVHCKDNGVHKIRNRRSTNHHLYIKTKTDRDVEILFEKYKYNFNRRYDNEREHEKRFKIFKANIKKINELNEHEQGTAKYGVTEFVDMTANEYKLRTGLLPNLNSGNDISHPIADIPDGKIPKSFDWREHGAVTEVKNQGNCGSCWAFSVTGNIEGLHAIKTGTLEEYSEQELLDCDTVDKACGGGLPDNAYKALEELGGLETESDYPYEAKKRQCHFNKTLSHVKVTGAVDLPQNETAMALWLVSNGPISIGINANAMQFYRGGISHPWRPLCRHGSLDHGVLIVGFGVADYPVFNKTLPYWIVKNSWGPEWGERGYYRVYRGDNTCGINSMATSAVLSN